MKALVTGGAGFIGSHLVDELLNNNYQVVCIDNLILGKKDFLSSAIKNKSFKFYDIDIFDIEKLDEIFQNNSFDIVFHLAANSDIRAGVESTDRDLNLTFQLTFNVLECMRRYNVKKILFTSSAAIFGSHHQALSEDIPMRPESLYGASKLASESFIMAFSNLYGIQSWILRLSNMVGSRSTHGILHDFLHKINNNSEHLVVLGNGRQNKPYMHVSELINCILFIIKNTNETINIFNVGPKDVVKVSEIAEIFLEKLGADQVIKYTGGEGGWKGDVPFYSHNSKKLEDAGWHPKFSSKEAIQKTIGEMVRDS